jgi:hypothetical protein
MNRVDGPCDVPEGETGMQTRSIALLLPLLAGPLAWAVHFTLIYAANGIFCARPALHGLWMGGLATAFMGIAAALALAVIGLVNWRYRRRWPATDDKGFFPWVAATLGLLSAIAIVWQTVPVLMLPACPSA